MTDRINALVVILDTDYRDDDMTEIVTAIGMVKHVIDVQMHVREIGDQVAYARAKAELQKKLYDILNQ